MPTIRQSVELPSPPDKLFDAYLNARTHAAITGGKVKISAKANSVFSAFDGTLSGKTLSVIPKRLIVQSWRSKMFGKKDADSLLVLAFGPGRTKGSGRIDILHVGVPECDFEGVSKGWPTYYWKPWRAYLKGR